MTRSPADQALVSVVVCSRRDPSDAAHQDAIAETIGVPHEYLRIDNRDGRYGICAAYNLGVERAQGDLIVFLHEDVWPRTPAWGAVLRDRFSSRLDVGLVGVAGTQRLESDNPAWPRAGRDYIRGQVVSGGFDGSGEALSVFNEAETDSDVVAVDGLFFAVRGALFRETAGAARIAFDAETFRGFHFYDLDISLQVLRGYKLLVTRGILVKHDSHGDFGASWRGDAMFFRKKWAKILPVDCSGLVDSPP